MARWKVQEVMDGEQLHRHHDIWLSRRHRWQSWGMFLVSNPCDTYIQAVTQCLLLYHITIGIDALLEEEKGRRRWWAGESEMSAKWKIYRIAGTGKWWMQVFEVPELDTLDEDHNPFWCPVPCFLCVSVGHMNSRFWNLTCESEWTTDLLESLCIHSRSHTCPTVHGAEPLNIALLTCCCKKVKGTTLYSLSWLFTSSLHSFWEDC